MTGNEDRFEEARRLLGSGQVEEAIAGLQQILTADPGEAEAHALLGIALGMKGEIAESTGHLETAIRLAPQQPTYHFNLGQVYEQSGDRSAAVAAYTRALQLDPAYPRAGEAYRRLTGTAFQAVSAGAGYGTPEAGRPAAPWLVGAESALPHQSGEHVADFNLPPRIPERRDWQSAPKVVTGWAYQLTWLAMVVTAMGVIFVPLADQMSPAEKFVGVLFYAVLLGLNVWLNRALKRGLPAAWRTQVALSTLGLVGFPLGTLIHGYILSQWFKPETKDWFGVS